MYDMDSVKFLFSKLKKKKKNPQTSASALGDVLDEY